MVVKHSKLIVAGVFIFFTILTAFRIYHHEIPKTWDVKAIKNAHLPPPDPSVVVEYPPESYYNSLPEHVIYKTYPVYIQGYEPAGYMDSLKELEPEIVFDANKIKTQDDWDNAGEHVFFWPANIASAGDPFGTHLDSGYFAASGDRMTKGGIYPFAKYVIMEKGKVQYGDLSCATCHSRVIDNGEVILGAQGNHAFDPGFGYIVEKFDIPMDLVNLGFHQLSGTPWYPDYKTMAMSQTREEMLANLYATPNGVMTRQGIGFNLPLNVPSLIGIRDIRYLDNTGLMRHDGPEDLMRYAALNQGMDMLISYNGFVPLDLKNFSERPKPEEWDNPFGYDPKRYSDAQLYALTQFIYSLKPPENPNTFSEEIVSRGEQVFIEQGCVTCHTPPLFTNNMLTPVDGFEPPEEHLETHDIFNVSVETDPRTSLYSRRGTGYYKIPSLRGVWYKGPFFHNGELATLEDVFDPARLKDDYVPTGFKPADVATRAVRGHDFGMDLPAEDKKAMIAFLKTL